MKNSKGFTLVELLVTVTLIAAVSVAIGFGVSSMIRNSRMRTFRSTYNSLFNYAYVYSLKRMNLCENGCYIYLKNLIEEGIMDDRVLKERNPLFKSELYFTENDIIELKYVEGEKKFIYHTVHSTGCILNYDDLDTTTIWETC